MYITECVAAISTMLGKAAEHIQCICCQDDSCFYVIINRFESGCENSLSVNFMLFLCLLC